MRKEALRPQAWLPGEADSRATGEVPPVLVSLPAVSQLTFHTNSPSLAHMKSTFIMAEIRCSVIWISLAQCGGPVFHTKMSPVHKRPRGVAPEAVMVTTLPTARVFVRPLSGCWSMEPHTHVPSRVGSLLHSMSPFSLSSFCFKFSITRPFFLSLSQNRHGQILIPSLSSGLLISSGYYSSIF